MILIGQFDSSYVRRVAIAMRLYGIAFEHQPWSVFGDGEKVQVLNPLMRVPTLVLDDGDVLVDSASMLDFLDGLIEPEQRLLPQSEPGRRRALKIVALATGLADKGVSLFYERHLHETVSSLWVARCHSQIFATLKALEESRVVGGRTFWFGETISHADIAVACAIRHVTDAHPHLIDLKIYPAIAAHCAALEALPVFRDISQAFIAPA